MGASQSNSQTHPPSRALHVLRVAPASPASQTNIEPFFDFVVGFEGDSLASQHAIDVSQLETIVENHEGRKLNLLVWNSKIQETRGRCNRLSSFFTMNQLSFSGSYRSFPSVVVVAFRTLHYPKSGTRTSTIITRLKHEDV
jgi:hypothetical protein